MGQKIIQVDAFTSEKFKGNPAGVCLMEKPADEIWMQNIAMEMNLSETAFIYPVENGYNLRWFTPLAEVDLCGHATLATAHVMFNDGLVSKDEIIRFQTKSGELKVRFENNLILLDFPALEVKETKLPTFIKEAINVESLFSGLSRFDYFIEVASPEIVRELKPDFGKLKEADVRGVIVSAKDGDEYDFISRFFAPGVGIDEDPVTGSAHCVLAPYWSHKLNKQEMTAYQASSRGGKLNLKVINDRVIIGGEAIVTIRGEVI